MSNTSFILRPNQYFRSAVDGLRFLFLALLALLFFVELGLSLRWRIWGDGTVLHYIAYLINEHGFVPYRDIFDPNLPGAYLFYMAVGKLFGYSDLAFRMVDVAWLTATLTVTWMFMKRVGQMVAAAGCLLFGLIYLGVGPYMGLQRDTIVLLPIATAILLITQRKAHHSPHVIHLLLGILFALAALVKPYAAIGLPALLIYSCIQDRDETKSVKALIKLCFLGSIFVLIGFLTALTLPIVWLWRIGALESFLELYSSYIPLYTQMSGDITFRSTFARLLNIVYWYLYFGGYGPLLVASLFGIYLVVVHSTSVALKQLVLLLLSLSILYSVSVAIGGKFWYYHWMPYIYFASLCTAMVLFSPSSTTNLRRSIILSLAVFIATTVLSLRQAYDTGQQLVSSPSMPVSRNAQVDEIASYLRDHLAPTDTVQSLDWTGGALPAIFMAKAVIATPYIFDFQFYHHVSTPYIQQLRKDFLTKLEQEKPRFIIDVYAMPSVSGIDTTNEFRELRALIERDYLKDYTGNGFDIFRRNDARIHSKSTSTMLTTRQNDKRAEYEK